MYDINRIHDYVYKEFNIRLDAYKSVQMNRRIENFISKLEFNTTSDFIRECSIDKHLRRIFRFNNNKCDTVFFETQIYFLD